MIHARTSLSTQRGISSTGSIRQVPTVAIKPSASLFHLDLQAVGNTENCSTF